ncbi:MAG: hypothetical protein RBR86_02875 [Pseudobdellovibrionaceae bacterium]|jgi:dCMP deaminase|nr:hypothetical protein [Pseudobdellovibrionaceae bacterium]
MNPRAFDAMQSAVDIVLTSPHPDNKVAASLFSEKTLLARTNNWPQSILDKIGSKSRIGDSSATVHAEVNCLLHFPEKTDGAEISITDPCCPNCAKSISESGIKTVYIDHKGFLKDFAARRGSEFKNMSLNILAHAGISIYEINRKEKYITAIHKPAQGYTPPETNPIEIVERPDIRNPRAQDLKALIKNVRVKHPFWGCAFATDKSGKIYSLVASTHLAIGYSEDRVEEADKLTEYKNPLNPEQKYNFILTPLNRLMFGATRHNLHLIEGMIWTSLIPTSREFVNFIGAGYAQIALGKKQAYLKESSLEALEKLESSGLLNIVDLD